MDYFKKKIVPDSDQNELERELTNKFLNGELSFTEYSQQWSGNNFNDEEENVESEDEDTYEDEQSRTTAETEQSPSGSKEKRGVDPDQKHRRVSRKARRHLPPALMGLMGEANLRYARGEKELAEKMCYEIIRQVPTASEPFQTLAQIYESDSEKFLQFSLIAAHLHPSDSEQWMRLAAISKERGDVKQEIFCYTKAINGNPKHVPYHLMRIESLKELEERNMVSASFNLSTQQCYMRLISVLPETEGPCILRMAKSVAQQYHSTNKLEKALRAMDIAYAKCGELFSFEDINLYLELLINEKHYMKCLNILVEKGGVDIEAEVQTVEDDGNIEEITHILSCVIHTSLPVDLRSKLMICLIHMKAYHLIDSLLDTILATEDINSTGDIYLDIEEALTNEGRHEEALRLLKPLVTSDRYGLAAVWLKYAECLTALGRTSEAIEPYKTVIQLAPQHLGARKKLSNLLKSQNRLDEALVALEQDEQIDILDTSLLYDRCQMLKSRGDLNGYLKVGELLLSRHFFKIRNREELNAFRIKDTGEILKSLRESRGEDFEEPNPISFDDSANVLTLQIEWELFQDMLKMSFDLGYYNTMERLAFSAAGSKRFLPFKSSLEFLTLMSCLANKDYYYAFNVVREFIQKSPEKPRVWNMLNLVIQKVDDTRHNKFLMRVLARQENLHKLLSLLHGNNCLMSGTYKYALKEYISCYKAYKLPLVALLCGVTMIHMACQKFSTNKHALMIQGIAFFGYYEKMRGSDGKQEAYYNTGRAFHQLGLYHMATLYYKKALDVDNDLIKTNAALNLQQEIAFNLHLIYKSDSPELALHYLEKYVVI